MTLVHTPNHASWLNQVEIYFSIVQRKVVTPNDFPSLRELEDRLLAFQGRYEQTAQPFQWAFTRGDLAASRRAHLVLLVLRFSLKEAPLV